MPTISPQLLPVLMLFASNVFMTFAWYGHLKFKESPLPLVIMEALASGLPVITCKVGALREQVEEGVNGFLIPPGDATALAEATLRLVRNPEMRRDMSVAARQSADRKFNASRNYPQVLAVCKRCVDAG